MRLRSLSVSHAIVAAVLLAALALPNLVVTSAGAKEDPLTRTWARTDWPVASGAVSRTWMWGPQRYSEKMVERYAESPNGERVVLYWDKSRMEITHPDAFDDGVWYVSNGLLVVELISGRMQTGDDSFEDRAPAQVNVAGDLDDASGPTFATFGRLLDAAPYGQGAAITTRVDRSGNLSDDPSLASQGVTAAHLVDVTGIHHQVASPFWAFMNAQGTVYEDSRLFDGPLFRDPFYATGYPITEAYWANVKVGGTQRDVLMQCFERRCLTYTPGNPDGWQVEAGNVGLQYFAWRYGTPPGGQPDDADDNRTLTVGQSLDGTIDPQTDQDTYYFDGVAGQRLSVLASAVAGSELDSVISLYGPDGGLVNDPGADDDRGGWLDALAYNLPLPSSGRYKVVVESYSATSSGAYTISLMPDDGAPTDGQIVYQSTLTDWSNDEIDQAQWFTADDTYHIRVKPNWPGFLAWNQTGDYADFSASVYLRRVSPASDSVGCLIVRSGLSPGDGAAYEFCINGNSGETYADYAGWFNGAYASTDLLPAQVRPTTYSPDQWNLLKIMASGNRLWFYLNGVLIGDISDTSSSHGAVGIIVGADDNSAAEFEFSNLVIRSVSGP